MPNKHHMHYNNKKYKKLMINAPRNLLLPSMPLFHFTFFSFPSISIHVQDPQMKSDLYFVAILRTLAPYLF